MLPPLPQTTVRKGGPHFSIFCCFASQTSLRLTMFRLECAGLPGQIARYSSLRSQRLGILSDLLRSFKACGTLDLFGPPSVPRTIDTVLSVEVASMLDLAFSDSDSVLRDRSDILVIVSLTTHPLISSDIIFCSRCAPLIAVNSCLDSTSTSYRCKLSSFGHL